MALTLAYDRGGVQLYCGDARELGDVVKAGSVAALVSSPPYWQRMDYGTGPGAAFADGWRGQLGLERDPDAWAEHVAEIYDVGATLLSPTGTSWVVVGDTYYGDSAVRQSRREAFSDTWDATQRASAGGRRRTAARLREMTAKALVGAPDRLRMALARRGWITRAAVIWDKGATAAGRVTDRPLLTHDVVYLFSRRRRYRYAVDRREGSVWAFPPASGSSAHPARYPEALAYRCIRLSLGASETGLVCDLFAGSGTTLAAASRMGYRAVGVELSERFCSEAVERLERLERQPRFAGV